MTTSHPSLVGGPIITRNGETIHGKSVSRKPSAQLSSPVQKAAEVFNFSDIPSEISHLTFNTNNAGATNSTNTTAATATDTAGPAVDPYAKNAPASNDNRPQTATAFRATTTINATAASNSSTPSSQTAHDSSSLTSASPNNPNASSHPLPASAVRKTSPGLAARLKALGFGTVKRSGSTSPAAPLPDRIGRLDEHQLRQLDEKHHAGSLNSVISRRGRPWKGAGATHTTYRSKVADEPDQTQDVSRVDSTTIDHPQLPEIKTSAPLDMDTQKYRLPDHTNSNGTKVTLETRREHLERSTLPPSPDDIVTPPPPPPKETPPAATDAPPVTPPSSEYVPGLSSYFTPGHNRPGSIYTLSRASFANQLAQLTSLQLPDAESLSSKVSAIPTAQLAAKALINAAEQIRSWISKALEVIEGLDSDDDVEWAAAGGREGLAEVESAIERFEELINVYVSAIEELQNRDDIANVEGADLKRAVSQMETIVGEWEKIRTTLNNVRAQVEIAMEWEELWNNVLGDIQSEMDELSRLVFEMEERRHKSIAAAAGGDGVDIGDLETIVEETPTHTPRIAAQSRVSLPGFPMSPSSPNNSTLSQDDSSLLALFARMQPLRASLDFLPMRLSVFQMRAEKSFPTACDELEMRRSALDASYKKLEKDAEVLRKELGEDRWVIVFRGAGRQAQKMHESVERSLLKLKESIDAGTHLTNLPVVVKKIESYEAKKTHYGPAIERVLSIIDRGVKDRLTVNGEILRLHADLQSRWASLKTQMKEMDGTLEELQADQKGQQLRDSVSSMLSNDQSTLGSGRETPGSSPPSSVVMSSLGFDPHTPVPSKSKNWSSGTSSKVPMTGNRRHSSLPAPTPQTGRRTGFSRLSTIAGSGSTTPLPASQIKRPGSTLDHRPRWNGSTNTSNSDTGHNFKPLAVTTPSPYSRKTPAVQKSASSITPSSGGSLLTTRSPVARAASESPRAAETTPSRPSHSRLSFRERLASPGPYAQQTLTKSRLSVQAAASAMAGHRDNNGNRRASLQPPRAPSVAEESQISRPASSLASSRRSSLLPQPRLKKEPPKDTRPKWR